jgi:hypothetical protein
VIEAGSVAILNKGQRSVKGLASGFEHVATLDLILSMRDRRADDPVGLRVPEVQDVTGAVASILTAGRADSPSHLYLELLRRGIAEGWDLSTLDLRGVTQALRELDWEIDAASGRLRPADAVA